MTAVRPDRQTGLPTFNPAILDVLPDVFRHGVKTPITFGVDFTPLAASGQSAAEVGLNANSYFILLAQTRFVTAVDNITAVPVPPITVQITDTGASRAFQNRAIHMENWFGSAQDPFLYPWPVIISPASTLTVTVANLVATAWNIKLAFHGFQAWGVRR